MTMSENLAAGDLITILTGEQGKLPGIMTQPITADHPGHALILKEGYIRGVTVTFDQVEAAEMATEGYAQLAYSLIKLGSHVIEKRLLDLI